MPLVKLPGVASIFVVCMVSLITVVSCVLRLGQWVEWFLMYAVSGCWLMVDVDKCLLSGLCWCWFVCGVLFSSNDKPAPLLVYIRDRPRPLPATSAGSPASWRGAVICSRGELCGELQRRGSFVLFIHTLWWFLISAAHSISRAYSGALQCSSSAVNPSSRRYLHHLFGFCVCNTLACIASVCLE